MTYRFGRLSLDNLTGVHPALTRVCHVALETGVMDFSIISGVRTIEQQEKLVEKGVSKTMRSKHLIQSDGYGHAVDLAPYPLSWNKVNHNHWSEIIRFGVLAGLMKSIAKEQGLTLIWGCDWDNDGQTLDHTFFDAPHFELREIT